MSRHSLSLRLSRSSQQATALGALTRSLAAHAKADAAERLRYEAQSAAADVAAAEARVAMRQAAMRLTAEAAIEQASAQAAQRAAALKAQRAAIVRSLREVAVDEEALLRGVRTEQDHAEAVFRARHVEPVAGPYIRSADASDSAAGYDVFDAADVDASYAAFDVDAAARYASGGPLRAAVVPDNTTGRQVHAGNTTLPPRQPDDYTGRRVHAGNTTLPPRQPLGRDPLRVARDVAATAASYAADDDENAVPSHHHNPPGSRHSSGSAHGGHLRSATATERVARRIASAASSFAQHAHYGPHAETHAALDEAAGAMRDALWLARTAEAHMGRAAAGLSHSISGRGGGGFGRQHTSFLSSSTGSGGGGGPRRVPAMGPSPFRTTIMR